MNKIFKVVLTKNKLHFYIYLAVAFIFIHDIEILNLSYRGDSFFPIFPIDEITFSAWRHDYHSGQTDLTKLFHNIPFNLIFVLLNELKIDVAVIQKLYFFFSIFLIQVSGYYFFKVFYENHINKKENIQFECLVIGLFFLLNPYIIFKFPSGQVEAVYAIAALIGSYIFFEKAIKSKKNNDFYNLSVLVIFSYFVFLQNFYFSFIYVIFFSSYFLFNLKKILKFKLKFFLILIAILIFAHGWALVALFNQFSTGISLIASLDSNDFRNLLYNSSSDLFLPISLLPNAIEKMFSEDQSINLYFTSYNYRFLNFIIFLITCIPFLKLKNLKIVKILLYFYIFFILIALGAKFAPYYFFYSKTDILSIFRNPTKFLLLLLIIQSLLFGLGINYIKKNKLINDKKFFKVFILSLLILRVGTFANGNFNSTLEGMKIPKEYYEIKKIIDLEPYSRIGILPYTKGSISYSWGPKYKGISFLDRFFKNPVFEIKYKDALNFNSLLILDLNKENLNKYVAKLRAMGAGYIILRKDINEFNVNLEQLRDINKNTNLEILYYGKFLNLYKLKNQIKPLFYCSDKNNLNYLNSKMSSKCPKSINFTKKNFLESYKIEITGEDNFILSSTMSFDSNWRLSSQNDYKKNLFINKYAIGWKISKSDFKKNKAVFELVFLYQSILFILHVFSIIIFSILMIFIMIRALTKVSNEKRY